MMNHLSQAMCEKLRIEKTAVEGISPWQMLANAIVEQAVKDYRSAQARIKANPQNADHAKADAKQLEKFFHSSWFELLTDVDGDFVLAQLRKETA